jgi:hypothetical protein
MTATMTFCCPICSRVEQEGKLAMGSAKYVCLTGLCMHADCRRMHCTHGLLVASQLGWYGICELADMVCGESSCAP